MKHSMGGPRGGLTAAIVAAAMLAATLPAAAEQPPPTGGSGTRIDVLLLGYYIWSHGYTNLCRKEGVNIHLAKREDPTAADPANYPVDYLKQFHVIVVSGPMEKPWGPSVVNQSIKPGIVDNLLEYNRQGGGLVWTPLGEGYGALAWNESTGRRIDAEALDESLNSRANRTFASASESLRDKLSYFWTTEVKKHPATDGVRGLFMGIDGEWGWPATIPMKFGSSWEVLVTGMPETRTVTNKTPPGGSQRAHTPSGQTGTYADRPQIIAVRPEGDGRQGRMMVQPIYTTWTWGNYGHPAMKEAFLFNGDGVHPSDGHRFLLNAWRWLAAPAIAAGFSGVPAAAPAPAAKAKVDPPDLSPVGWEAQETIDWGKIRGGPWMRGLIGARSQYGGGAGTVAEWVAAAKAAGLQYLVFVDDIGTLSADGYAKLIADCKAATDNTFTAIPGLGGYDADGVYRFLPGLDRMPSPLRLTEDGKRFKEHVGICTDSSWATWPVMAEFGKAKYDLWWNHVIAACAPLVYDKGRLVDDAVTRWWYEIEKDNMRLLPLSLVHMDKPSDLAEAARNAHLTVLRTDKGGDIVPNILRWGFSGQIFPSYLTSGPEIAEWVCHGGPSEPYRPNSSRFRLLIKVRSAAGIAKVTLTDLFDGTAYRDWRPGGKPEFTVAVDEPLDRHRLLALVVTDVNGRTAIAPPAHPQMNGNRVWHMSDRLMGLHHRTAWNQDHAQLVGGVGTAQGLGYQKGAPLEATGEFSTGHAERLKFQGIEGAGCYPPAFKLSPTLRVAGTLIQPAYRYHLALSGHDLTVLDYSGTTRPLQPDAAFTFEAPPSAKEPTPYADVVVRSWGLRQPLMTPVEMVLEEITVAFKQDCRPESLFLGLYHGPDADTDFNLLSIRPGVTGDAQAWTFKAGEKFYRKTAFVPGGYLYQAKMLAGTMGFIALDDRIMAESVARAHQFQVRPELLRDFKAGETITLRMLRVARAFDDQQGNSEWLQQLIADYGIGTGRPGYPYEVVQGQAKEINYIFDLQAENGGAAIKIGKYPLASTLPLRVTGIRATSACGEYDLESKRIRPLPVFEASVTTSVQPAWAASHLYIGEWLTWDRNEARISLVQDGVNFQLEAHNPTDQELTVRLAGAPGFAPLAEFTKTLTIPPHQSITEHIPTEPGSVQLTPLRY